MKHVIFHYEIISQRNTGVIMKVISKINLFSLRNLKFVEFQGNEFQRKRFRIKTNFILKCGSVCMSDICFFIGILLKIFCSRNYKTSINTI